MSHRRFTTAEECRFFRGAASSRHEPPDGVIFKFRHGWDVCCNWPRDGAYVAQPGDGYEHPGTERAVGGGAVPSIFLQAWDRDE
jgi:hypothetical protein